MKDYKKKYEQLLKFINDLYPHMSDYCKEKTEGFIPELKESEDERIRKALIQYLKDYPNLPNGNYCRDDFFAWLEKQGEQKEINLVEILKHYPRETELYSPLYGKLWLAEVDEEHEIITCYKRRLSEGCTRAILKQEDTVSFYSNGTTGLPDCSITKDCMLFLYNNEKQGEQKATDKIEPKFKVGDFIINGYGFIMQIDGIDGDVYVYHVLDDNRLLKHDITKTDESCHLWTIQDAKYGDVLDANGAPFTYKKHNKDHVHFHCGVNLAGEFIVANESDIWSMNNKIHPATKEQRDLLFQKMKEAGYKWDADKKELKKIGQEEDAELTDFESALFSAFSDAWQEYLSGKEVNVAKWTREHSAELLEVARKQKPTWSEDDEKGLGNALWAIKKAITIVKDENDMGNLWYAENWLKSLKERMIGE